MSESSTSTHPMQVSLSTIWEIEVNDYVNGGNINASGEEICGNQTPALPFPEIMKNFIPFLLRHSGMNVVAGEIHLKDFLGQKFHSEGRIAKNDHLLNF